METNLLFPNRFKRIGWILLIPSSILSCLTIFEIIQLKFLDLKVFAILSSDLFEPTIKFGLVENNISLTLFGILSILGTVFVAFSREHDENELIAKVRLESLIWASYINYSILIFCLLFFWGFAMIYIVIFSTVTPLFFFIIRFYYILYKTRNSKG